MNCCVDGCPKPVRARGWCGAHYENFRRNGDPIPLHERTQQFDRVMARVVQEESGCWRYDGFHDRKGYATLIAHDKLGTYLGKGPGARHGLGVYRFLYLHMEGPIPTGLHLDHLCRERWCVNPGHLEPVTPQENHRRGIEDKQHCVHGHEYTPENTTWQGPNKDARACRTCHRERATQYRRARGVSARAS